MSEKFCRMSYCAVSAVLYVDMRERSYKRSQLYQLVADVPSYPSFVPFCTRSRIIKRHEQGIYSSADPPGTRVMDAELSVGFLSFDESYVSRVTCKPFQSVEVCSGLYQ
jgi:coenzyme Q-binding protein COQ10